MNIQLGTRKGSALQQTTRTERLEKGARGDISYDMDEDEDDEAGAPPWDTERWRRAPMSTS